MDADASTNADFLEDRDALVNLAAQAGREAHQRALATGKPVLIAKDGWIVQVFADGTSTRIRRLLTSEEQRNARARALGK